MFLPTQVQYGVVDLLLLYLVVVLATDALHYVDPLMDDLVLVFQLKWLSPMLRNEEDIVTRLAHEVA